MNRWTQALALTGVIAAGLVFGCADSAPEAVALGAAARAISADDVCPAVRWIGRVAAGHACPAVPQGSPWFGQRLFAGIAENIPPPLDEFCLYEWTAAGDATPGTLPFYGNRAPSEWLNRDCAAVAALGAAGDATELVSPNLEQAFLAQVEAPASVPSVASPAAVRVAIVDTWPDGLTVGNSHHGFGMGRIIKDLTCDAVSPSGPCYVTLAPHLALNLVGQGERDNVDGGYFGFQSKLALAIFEALVSWQANQPTAKLIINLSVGWDASDNLNADGTVRASVQAARAALDLAACAGALVIAAAGNGSGGQIPSVGPMVPAAWEKVPAPGCAAPVTRPLVYAAGGVDGRDLPLRNARPQGRPRIAAPSFAVPATVTAGSDTFTFGPFTGSSVSAAVVSAIAATLWHLDGTQRADQVMAKIASTGVLTSDTADFCLAPPCAAIRRASLCRAAEAIVGPLACTKIAYQAGTNPEWTPAEAAAVEALASPAFDGTSLTQLVSPAECSSDVYVTAGAVGFPGPYPCPAEELPSETLFPGVAPQPGVDPCPACSMAIDTSGSTLLLTISEEIHRTVYPYILTLSSRTGVVERYDLASAEDSGGASLGDGVQPGGVYKVALPRPNAVYGVDFDYASIEWVSSPEIQTTSSLVVWEE